jgi:hypothetical protein
MMIFGILGWTLAVMQTGTFESSLRAVQSEQALYLAEAGVRWGINGYISDGNLSSADDTCAIPADWITHTLAPGQYQVCIRPPQTGETGSVVVESIGYVPTVAAYQSKRQVKIMASVGSFDKTVMAQGLFNWTGADEDDSRVTGDMICMYYEANGNHVYNEEGIDYANADRPRDVLPRTDRARLTRREVGEGIFPEIDMTFFENASDATVLGPANTSVIANVAASGADTQITVSQADFFGADAPARARRVGHALRNISRGSWKNGTWKDIKSIIDGATAVLNGTVAWLKDERVTIEPGIALDPVFNAGQHTYNITFNGTASWPVGQAVRDFSKGTWNYTDWGVISALSSVNNKTNVTISMDTSVTSKTWQAGDWIGVVRRFTSADAQSGGLLDQKNLLYIESDVLFDARSTDIDTSRTGIVVEGDAAIRGPRRIHLEKRPLLYPNLATKNGAIYSPDLPAGNNRNQRLDNRNFDDVIFSENGDILFNYVDCMAMYGRNITLSGVFNIRYDSQLTRIGGYGFGVSSYDWKEQ